MKRLSRIIWASIVLAMLSPFASSALATGRYYEIAYPPSDRPGGLQVGVIYTFWIPDGTAKLRELIVHQHGAGVPACQGGATAAYDLHWQALAKKWDCVLLGPSYQQSADQNARLWSDPRNGSAATFLKAISDVAAKSRHPELEKAPWCLWGHSAGGSWSSLMQMMYPEQIVACWFRSGTAYGTWEKRGIPKPEIPDAFYSTPMMCNPGVKEKGHAQFNGAWTGTLAMFEACGAKGAPIGFAPDPRTAHECGDSRYLAIRFFDACLAMRLPDPATNGQKLRPVDMKQAWLATPWSDEAQPAASYSGKAEAAIWLPNETVAKAWAEYVKTGAAGDTTPPPAPINVKATPQPDGTIEITWDAEADLESGMRCFIIRRDGKDIAQLPGKLVLSCINRQ